MTSLAFTGNIAVKPETAVTASGRPFVRFTVAENQGHRDRVTNEWVEDAPTFWPVTVWGDAAENIAESFQLGDRVTVTGRTRTNTWENEAGEKRSRIEVTADDVAASTRFARVKVAKVQRAESPAGAAAGVEPPY